MPMYPTIANRNYEMSFTETGKQIHMIRLAAENGLLNNHEAVTGALKSLEETLIVHSTIEVAESADACRSAEAEVIAAWSKIAESIEATHFYSNGDWYAE
jgi:hypothetical protein